MARYSIEDTTLTALGDAIRDKSGKQTKTITVMEEVAVDQMKVSKTANATGFETWEGKIPQEYIYDVISFPGAAKILVKIGWQFYSSFNNVSIGIGEAHNANEFGNLTDVKQYVGDAFANKFYSEDTYEADTITFYYNHGFASYNYLGYYAECYALDADGNVISGGTALVPVEKEVPNTMTPLQMASEIRTSLSQGLPQEAFIIKGNCQYKFNAGGWDWFLNLYGDKITTKDVSNCNCMFQGSSVETIPFDINCKGNYLNFTSMFKDCKNLTNVPKVVGRPDTTDDMFCGCEKLREIPDDAFEGIDWSYIDSQTSSYSSSRDSVFQKCYSLRKFPMSFLAHGNPVGTYSYSIYYNLFGYCFALDELVGLPVVHRKATWTSNAFSYTFQNCYRLKDIIFETNEDGSPIKIDTWSKQTIDLSGTLGYGTIAALRDSAGFTTDKQVIDDATYQALKDDLDWWTTDVNYSRYNHDSAVRTINSLPDLSTKGGNTIKFKKVLGTKTDGGAVGNLTAEEIAVATAKGWTVSLV